MYSETEKAEVKKLFIAGKKIIEIESETNVHRRTIYNWVISENWSDGMTETNTLAEFNRRMIEIINIKDKTAMNLREMEITMNCIERLKKIEIQEKLPQKERDFSEPREKKSRQKSTENDFSEIIDNDFVNVFLSGLFGYQKICWENRHQRTRNILKARQIGMTYYFAGEALADAILSGKNKIFLSASRNQSDVFREYIRSFSEIWFKKTPKGKDKITIKISNEKEVTFYFLSTNSATAQSYHGDVYIDEYFWIPSFNKLKTVATAMASQKQYTKTFFSTPSSKMHEAYPLWSGNDHQEKLKKRNQPLELFPDDSQLEEGGRLCADGQWRFRIPLKVAEKYGCNLFSRKNLENEYSEAEFAMLFDCVFIDDNTAVFKVNKLMKCVCDSLQWRDVDWKDDKNYLGEIWLGYDPARNGDSASLALIIPPEKIGGKFRILDKILLKNTTWSDQAEFIKKLTEKYLISEITIDRTGQGSAVYEAIQAFYPQVRGINYSIIEKNKLVNKMIDVIEKERIIWDASFSDIPMSFAQIKRSVTSTGIMTYVASRSNITGHADIAWAIMHAISNEDLIINENQTSMTSFSFCD